MVREFAGGWFGKAAYQRGAITEAGVRAATQHTPSRRSELNFARGGVPMTRHLILCGGLTTCQGENGQKHELTIADVPGGIDLRVEQLQRQMVSDIPDILIDLLDPGLRLCGRQ